MRKRMQIEFIKKKFYKFIWKIIKLSLQTNKKQLGRNNSCNIAEHTEKHGMFPFDITWDKKSQNLKRFPFYPTLKSKYD